MMVMVAVVPSVVIKGECRERRTQKHDTEQECNQRFLQWILHRTDAARPDSFSIRFALT
jgi:hypothetical protein